MTKIYEVNHPISGQLFSFTRKSDCDVYIAEVFSATGYAVQPVVRGNDDPEPVVTVTDPVGDNAPKGATDPTIGVTTPDPEASPNSVDPNSVNGVNPDSNG